MKVQRATLTVLSAPVASPVEMSFSQLEARTTVLLELEADGLRGVGESWVNYPSWAPVERLATLEHGVLPLLAGLDVSDPPTVQRELGERLVRVARQWGAPGPVWQALSAVDMALWDLAARARDLPVSTLLATEPPLTRVPVYASGVGPTDVEEHCATALAAGIGAVKARVGFGRERDEETLSRVRACVGPRVEVLVDANQAWSVDEARDFWSWARAYDISWLEEPVSGNRLEDLASLGRAVEVPLACGENLYGLDEFARYARSGVVGMIQPDLAKSGGFTLAADVADLTPDGVVVAPHCYGGGIVTAASVHFAAACRVASRVELDVHPNPLRDALVGNAMAVADGTIQVPTGPGLGVELDLDVVDRHLVDKKECDLHEVV